MRKILIFSLVILVLLFGCKKGLEQKNIGESSNKILIAGVKSDFKEKVMKQLFDKFSDDYSFEIRPLKVLRSINYSDYSKILVIDSCEAWMKFNPTVSNHLSKLSEDDKKKLILFITAGDPEWQFSSNGVDAITSASEDDKLDNVVKQISERIEEK